MIYLYGYGNKMVEGIWGTILKAISNLSAYRALQPLSAMIFSHFLKYCHRCLPSWITSYRIITIENNFFLLKIISVCIGPGFTIWAYKKYWHFWSSGSKVDLKDTNHIFIWLVILTISTFRRVWLFVLTNFMFLLQRWCIEKKVGMWIVSVIIKMVYKRMNPDTRWKEKFTCADI